MLLSADYHSRSRGARHGAALEARVRRPGIWRPSRNLYGSGNLVQVGPDGKVRVRSGAAGNAGAAVAGANDPCCCIAAPPPPPPFGACECCSDRTPANFTVTVSGIINCTCFLSLDGFYRSLIGSINGNTYCVPQASRCSWRLTGSSAVEERAYTNSTCGAIFSSSTFFDVRVSMSCNDALTTHSITLRILGGASEIFYSELQRPDNNCVGSFTLVDSRIACGSHDNYCGYGGTAVVTNDC